MATTSKATRRVAALKQVWDVFARSGRMSDVQRTAVCRAVELFQEDKEDECRKLLSRLSPEALAEFWRSYVFAKIVQCEEDIPTKQHAVFWFKLAFAAVEYFEHRSSPPPRNVVALFPRSES